jgi:hypothetical protein
MDDDDYPMEEVDSFEGDNLAVPKKLTGARRIQGPVFSYGPEPEREGTTNQRRTRCHK